MPRFVVLEHYWQGTHWDVMFESGDVLRTWAVDLRIAPDVDLPARALPDHRLAYLEFEGPISGGRGMVRRIDQGTYETIEWGDELVRVRLWGAQLFGEAELRRVETCRNETRWLFRFGNRS